MKEPFATYPNAVRSAAMYYSKDGQTRKLYVQFAGYREGDFIETYDFQTKEWRMFMFYVPFAEISWHDNRLPYCFFSRKSSLGMVVSLPSRVAM